MPTPPHAGLASLATLVAALLLAPPHSSAAQSRQTGQPPPAAGAERHVGRLPTTSYPARIFEEVFRAISRNHDSAPNDSTYWEEAIEYLVEQLDDPYAVVLSTDEVAQFTESNTGNYAGIGVQITLLNGRVTVTAVFDQTPAQRAGMALGDQIVEVEDEDAREWSLDQARDAIRGEPGSVVRIGVAREGFANPVPFAITRDNVHIPAVEATRLEGDVVYVRVHRFARNVAQELASSLDEASDAAAFVVDLRGNPGGYLDESLRVADLFLAPGRVVASVDQRDADGAVRQQSWRARARARVPGKPIVLMVDEFTASAPEIVAGALQDHDRALVVGERTFGKGLVQSVYPLSDGRRFRLTTGSWYTPLGRSLHRPRDRNGVPKPDPQASDDDGKELVATTPAGRLMKAGGGVYPDVEVVADTFGIEVRQLVEHATDKQVLLFARMEEYAFGRAQAARASGATQPLPASAFDELAQELTDAGLDKALLDDPVARSWMEWRTQVRYLSRAGAMDLALAVQARRDRVLAEAIRLASSASTTDELLALAGVAGEDAPPEPR